MGLTDKFYVLTDNVVTVCTQLHRPFFAGDFRFVFTNEVYVYLKQFNYLSRFRSEEMTQQNVATSQHMVMCRTLHSQS